MRTKNIGNLSEEIEKRTRDICTDFRGFTDGIRYVALLHRSKDGGSQNSEYHRRGGFYITHSPEQYQDAVVRLLTLKAVATKPYRLYASVNSRDIKKAEKAFKMDMLMLDFDDGENKQFFWERLDSKWCSALMQPGSRFRGQSSFLLDIDYTDEIPRPYDICAPILKWLGERNIDVLKQYPTENGYHVITPPFDPSDFNIPNCEIKKDGLLLLEGSAHN